MRKLTYYITYLIIGICLLTTCIDPVNVDIESAAGNLVVDGLITDQPGPHLIKLSNSKGYLNPSSSDNQNLITSAEIIISDINGNIIQLEETGFGEYSTPASFSGQVGQTYMLEITLVDGRIYRSEPETLNENKGIESLNYQFESKEVLNENNRPIIQNGFNILLTTNLLDEDLYYRWRYKTTYEVTTFPELKTTVINGQPVADPPPCSGYDVHPFFGPFLVGPCTCCTCWVVDKSKRVIISKPDFFSGQYKDLNLAYIADIDGKFSLKFHIEVEQLSLSKKAHSFWSQIESQQNQGSLFDQPTGQVISNIYSVDDPSEKVLGYFSASSVKSESLFIDPLDFPVRTSRLDSINDDCRKISNSTNVRPSFW